VRRRPGQGSIAALDAPTRELVQKINATFNALSVASGEFVQVAPDGSRTQGRFYLQKPGKVRFDYAPPSPIEFISDGGSIAVRDRKLATQDITPLSQTPLRFLLAERIDLLRDAPVIAVQKDDLFVSVVLEERHPVAGTHRLMLMFGADDLQLKQWTVTDPQGFDTTVAIYNVDTTKRPSADLFRINYERVLQ
ncbi:MAG: outer membrane lipoprotein carrier protein LolA, partial [Methylacidiphilales bacterium]|nr:outer membrane lipoprotein carrier protein LolA [Candidatus Methylacidiphilales bacterium]